MFSQTRVFGAALIVQSIAQCVVAAAAVVPVYVKIPTTNVPSYGAPVYRDVLEHQGHLQGPIQNHEFCPT